jgi:ABC-type sugar transport system permease subunit
VTGPNDARTQTLSALLYQIVIQSGNIGLGSAFSVVVLVIVSILATLFVRRFSRAGC